MLKTPHMLPVIALIFAFVFVYSRVDDSCDHIRSTIEQCIPIREQLQRSPPSNYLITDGSSQEAYLSNRGCTHCSVVKVKYLNANRGACSDTTRDPHLISDLFNYVYSALAAPFNAFSGTGRYIVNRECEELLQGGDIVVVPASRPLWGCGNSNIAFDTRIPTMGDLGLGLRVFYTYPLSAQEWIPAELNEEL